MKKNNDNLPYDVSMMLQICDKCGEPSTHLYYKNVITMCVDLRTGDILSQNNSEVHRTKFCEECFKKEHIQTL
jgi:hypothetical protein